MDKKIYKHRYYILLLYIHIDIIYTLQVIQKSKGWPVPAYAGVCGRLEVVAHEGEPLSALQHIEWHKKLKYAQKILNAAMDFTFKHDR